MILRQVLGNCKSHWIHKYVHLVCVFRFDRVMTERMNSRQIFSTAAPTADGVDEWAKSAAKVK